ncbi:hypothetical protein FRB90_012043 [Tulasnella sp. 427]|nr:hypothetical protein FRB90_012043 [Tulasnella sp. 427]
MSSQPSSLFPVTSDEPAKSSERFPYKLYNALEDLDSRFPRYIEWNSAGNAFQIADINAFTLNVLPEYFPGSTYDSFLPPRAPELSAYPHTVRDLLPNLRHQAHARQDAPPLSTASGTTDTSPVAGDPSILRLTAEISGLKALSLSMEERIARLEQVHVPPEPDQYLQGPNTVYNSGPYVPSAVPFGGISGPDSLNLQGPQISIAETLNSMNGGTYLSTWQPFGHPGGPTDLN